MLKPANGYKGVPKQGVSNLYYNEIADDLQAPCVWSLTGLRGSGKSYIISQYLMHSQKRRVPLYDRVFIVTPSWKSNRSYWVDYIDDESAKQPTEQAVAEIMEELETERDEWDAYVREMRTYKDVTKKICDGSELTDDEAVDALRRGYLEPETWLNGGPPPPQWKRSQIRPAQCCLIFDDCLGHTQMMGSPSVMKLAIMNRHLGGLEEPFKFKGNIRTAIGCSVLYATQVFKATQGGPAKPLRANNTHATIFRVRDPGTFDDVATEMGSFVGKSRFVQAYKLATSVDHGSLTVTFKPQRPELQFRRGLGELIVIQDKEAFEELEGTQSSPYAARI